MKKQILVTLGRSDGDTGEEHSCGPAQTGSSCWFPHTAHSSDGGSGNQQHCDNCHTVLELEKIFKQKSNPVYHCLYSKDSE